jgi:hypothetical protein
MGNKSTAGFDPQNPTAEPKLEHAYAHIGISAVAAALPFGPALSPNNRTWPQNDERVTRRCLRSIGRASLKERHASLADNQKAAR